MLFQVAALAAAVPSGSISSQCQQALTGVAASPDATCLNPNGLISLFVSTSSNSSIVNPIDQWLQGLCSQAPCSNSTLSTIVANVTGGCGTELQQFGYSSSDESNVANIVQLAYPTARKVVCLKDTSANQLCVTETLNTIQSSVGTLSVNNIVSMIPAFATGSTQIPKNATCSNCVKEAYNVVNTDFPGVIPSSLTSSAQSTCGSSFTDGQTPSGIQQTASNGTGSGQQSGAMSVSAHFGAGVTGLVVISSLFALLA